MRGKYVGALRRVVSGLAHDDLLEPLNRIPLGLDARLRVHLRGSNVLVAEESLM